MKKTININLSGMVFTIDEDAYQILSHYLDTIKSYFSKSEGRDEIMADIEARIAELLQDRVNDNKQVVNSKDIDVIIETLGQPEDFVDSDTEEDTFSDQQSYSRKQSGFKRLYRDRDKYILGGVCEGLGHYFGLDPLWIRAAFLIAFFGFGTGLLLYIILWVIVPAAHTTAEKLEMRGEPVNVNNIGRSIEDEMSNVKNKFNDFKNSGRANEYGRKTQNAVESILQRIWEILLVVLKFLGKAIGVLLIIGGASGLIGFIISLFGAGAAATTLGAISFENFHLGDMNEFVFSNSAELYLGVIGFILLCIAPILAIIYGGLAILIPVGKSAKSIGFGLLGIWLVGILLTGYTAFAIADEYSNEGTITEINDLDQFNGDTLHITASKLSRIGEKHAIRFNDDYFGKITSDSIYMGNIDLNITKSATDQFVLLVEKESRGATYADAEKNAESIMYDFNHDSSNVLELDAFFRMDVSKLWRAQEVYLELMVPSGKTVYLDPSLEDMLDDVHNVTNTYDRKMLGHYWTMTDRGLMSPSFFKSSNTEEDDESKQEKAKQEKLRIHSNDHEFEVIIN
jgi:phage shock protein PspC (stress-responsive transcriptional regulator)